MNYLTDKIDNIDFNKRGCGYSDLELALFNGKQYQNFWESTYQTVENSLACYDILYLYASLPANMNDKEIAEYIDTFN